jgi:hypothetical protein
MRALACGLMLVLSLPLGGPRAAQVLRLAGATGAREAVMGRVDLSNGHIVVGILPPLGGRVVVLRASGGENLLDADSKYWSPPFPEPSLDTPLQPWNGRIVWTGPQSGFWSQQDLRPDLKAGKAGWPPDPFNESGRFEIVERTPLRLRLKGTTSPVTGLCFEHEYEITGERTVRMKATATNGRETPVSWDLWPNTRVRPDGFPYVPLDPTAPLRVDGPEAGTPSVGRYPHDVRDGWLTVPPGRRPEPPLEKLWAKAFVRPAQGLIAYFRGPGLLLIRADVVAEGRLHPEQAFIEVYRGAGRTTADDILELEMHGPYVTLAPGESTRFEQTFELLEYDGPAGPEGHLDRLRHLKANPRTGSPSDGR